MKQRARINYTVEFVTIHHFKIRNYYDILVFSFYLLTFSNPFTNTAETLFYYNQKKKKILFTAMNYQIGYCKYYLFNFNLAT